jgi:hypothetical protein
VSSLLGGGRVDRRGGRKWRRRRRPADESLRRRGVGGVELPPRWLRTTTVPPLVLFTRRPEARETPGFGTRAATCRRPSFRSAQFAKLETVRVGRGCVGAGRAGDDRGRWPRPDQPARAHRSPPAGGLPQAGTYALFELGTGDPSLVGRGTVPPLPRLSGEPRWIWAPRAFNSAADERETPNCPTVAPLTSNAKRAERLVHYRCPDGILMISQFRHLERHDGRVSASNSSRVCERPGASHRSRPD